MLELEDEYIAKLKDHLIRTTNAPIYYEQPSVRSTHHYLRLLMAEHHGCNFLQSPLNSELRSQLLKRSPEVVIAKEPFQSSFDDQQVIFQGCF